jgi:hypothetical protein
MVSDCSTAGDPKIKGSNSSHLWHREKNFEKKLIVWSSTVAHMVVQFTGDPEIKGTNLATIGTGRNV